MLTERRSVYPTDEIPHLWAHGLPSGRRIRNRYGNLYAEGDTIYSYGAHFPIARRVVDSRGGVSYLLTTRSYSVTTSGHVSSVRQAMAGNGDIFALDPTDSQCRDLWRDATDGDGAIVAEWYQSRIDAEAAAAAKPRIRATTRERHIVAAQNIAGEWRRLREALGIETPADAVQLPGTLEEVRAKYAAHFARMEEERKARAAAERERVEREEAARAERERVARSALLPAWREGGESSVKAGALSDRPQTITLRDLPHPVLRLSPTEPGTVETSLGARVPLAEVEAALRFAPKALAERDGRGVARVEARFHNYGAPLVTDESVRVGCHTIPWEEVRAFCDCAGIDYPAGLPA